MAASSATTSAATSAPRASCRRRPRPCEAKASGAITSAARRSRIAHTLLPSCTRWMALPAAMATQRDSTGSRRHAPRTNEKVMVGRIRRVGSDYSGLRLHDACALRAGEEVIEHELAQGGELEGRAERRRRVELGGHLGPRLVRVAVRV